MEPLSAALGIAVEQRAELAEGAGDEADRLVTSLDDGALVCTHGDVIAQLIGSGRRAHKGSVWLLQPHTLEPVEYLRARV